MPESGNVSYQYTGERDYGTWERDTLELGTRAASAFRRENEPGWSHWWLFRLGFIHA